MGRQYITPQQDASIYEQFPRRNTGFDEILEIGKTRETSGAIRVLIEFDTNKFIAPFSSSYFLNLRFARAENFKRNQALEIYTVAVASTARAATGSLLMIDVIDADGEGVTIDGKVYLFQDNAPPLNSFDSTINTGGEDDFPAGTGSVAIMAANLIAAINSGTNGLGEGAGVAYSVETTLHPTVTASAGSGSTVIVTAKNPGVAGNSLILLTSNTDNFTVSGDFLIGGEDGVSGSWDEGTGFFEQDLENSKDGATWQIRNDDDDNWTFANGTASLGGSTGSLVATQSFDWEPTDVRIDITNQVKAWLTGSENNGLLIKIPTVDEENAKVRSNLRFFSRNTHTIYPPTLEAVWNTQTMSIAPNCGLSPAPEEIDIFVPNMRPEMTTGSVHRVRFGVRSANVVKSFSKTAQFRSGFFLPSGSHIGIQDAATKAFVVPFDTGSLLSADNTGSYFDLKIENMYINRTYKILVRTTKPWGTEVVDTGHRFRVV